MIIWEKEAKKFMASFNTYCLILYSAFKTQMRLS